VVGAVVLLIALLPSAYFYNKYQDSKAKTEDPEASEQAETEMLIKEISEHALLPTDEEPTVATVSDVTQLADQPFFNDAVNGDRLLVYSKAQKVVLYRPSIKRVINMTSLNIENTTEGTTPAQ
jgi:hypothetical protein